MGGVAPAYGLIAAVGGGGTGLQYGAPGFAGGS